MMNNDRKIIRKSEPFFCPGAKFFTGYLKKEMDAFAFIGFSGMMRELRIRFEEINDFVFAFFLSFRIETTQPG